jgi:hypothetical protein
MLMLDRHVDTAILAINDDSILRTGAPFDRFDLLVIAGTQISSKPGGDKANHIAWDVLAKQQLPACTGNIVIITEAGDIDTSMFEHTEGLPSIEYVESRFLVETVAKKLITFSRNHALPLRAS